MHQTGTQAEAKKLIYNALPIAAEIIFKNLEAPKLIST